MTKPTNNGHADAATLLLRPPQCLLDGLGVTAPSTSSVTATDIPPAKGP